MGYTHYWTQKRDITAREWATATADVHTILKQAQLDGIELADAGGEAGTKPDVDAQQFSFNGVDDAGHETFQINRLIDTRAPRYDGDNPAWAFCKTAQKPYDTAVTAVLCYLASALAKPAFTVTSDGDVADWQDGLTLARKALPNLDVLAIPLREDA